MSAVVKFIRPQSDIIRRAADSDDVTILTDIYKDDTNIAIWRRDLSSSLKESINAFLASNNSFKTAMTVNPDNVIASLEEVLGNAECKTELSQNIYELVDMFCLLFELNQVGLRLTTLDRAMCPKFHYDRVPCRLVTTYHGVATEWLPHANVNRTKLGLGSNGLADSKSGLYKNEYDIQKLTSGDVALLKGELWEGNEDAGLVHRSPTVAAGENRLVLTLDFAS